jgi:predicted RNase H-like HicB family nuclease
MECGIEVNGVTYQIALICDNNRFVAESSDFPSCVSQGSTEEAALNNIKEAIAAQLKAQSQQRAE